MRPRTFAVLLILAAAAASAAWVGGARLLEAGSGSERAPGERGTGALAATGHSPPAFPRVRWRQSRTLGSPSAGSLANGVQLPATGRDFFTWDPVRKTRPNRPWRRFGTDDAVRRVLRVLRQHRRAHKAAPRVGIGDISRPHGGDFGPRFGSPGHSTHQNGLDVDLYYPRRDRRERAPIRVSQIDRRLAQDLVDRFIAAGAEKVLVGPATGLRGPSEIVVPLINHDNHLHVRFPAAIAADG
jgi:murein endopeptidase